MTDLDTTKEQEFADRFYVKHGPCCAGCDWWHRLNSSVGECRKGAPVPARQRWGMLGFHNASLRAEAGHVVTTREHHCGEFKDTFDWTALPPAYLQRIGGPPSRVASPDGAREPAKLVRMRFGYRCAKSCVDQQDCDLSCRDPLEAA